MAGSSLFALLDDIATILDDVSVMTKVAAQKTAGVLGDDLALNAQQVSGVSAKRELPVVFAVAKGSFVNKLILVPSALTISFFLPQALQPLLMLGGAYLCFEGFEKIVHAFANKDVNENQHQELLQALSKSDADIAQFEKDKIKGAIRTDFILSAEIVTITLGTVSHESLTNQIFVLSAISILMTFGVYGLVACIVKLDDLGFYLCKVHSNSRSVLNKLGQGLIHSAPYLMRFLSFAGTLAMFMVGGGILVHMMPMFSHLSFDSVLLQSVLPLLLDILIGVVAGALCFSVLKSYRYFRGVK